MRNLIINADDYAMDGGVDAAILKLAARGTVTATSAMVLSPRWAEASGALKDAPLSRGLHLDFTSPFVEGVFPRQRLSDLIVRSQLGLLDRALLRNEIDRQLTLFESPLARPPDFIDGHQHVHHIPIMRDALLDALADRYGSEAKRIGLRNCAPRHWRGVKAAIVAGTGASGLARLAATRGHRTNTDFAGVYNFAPSADLASDWQAWLGNLEGSLPIVMCHVAIESDESHGTDPIREARWREYDWLASGEFLVLLQWFSANPVRWPPA
jgi:chitin disaccharide deacetylase